MAEEAAVAAAVRATSFWNGNEASKNSERPFYLMRERSLGQVQQEEQVDLSSRPGAVYQSNRQMSRFMRFFTPNQIDMEQGLRDLYPDKRENFKAGIDINPDSDKQAKLAKLRLVDQADNLAILGIVAALAIALTALRS